jgi:AcrR family transcriptional regulator
MRGRPPQIPEDALLDAAAEVLLRDGSAATTAAIARRAGVSEGLLFYRHKSKEELIAAVIDRQMRPSPRLVELIRDPGDRPLSETLQELCRHVLEVIRRAVPYVEIVRAMPDSLPIIRSLILSGATPDRIVDLVARYFEAEMGRGRMRPLAPSIAGRVIVGAMVERTLAERSPMKAVPLDDDEAFLRGTADLLLHGAAAVPPVPPGSRRR